MCFPFLSPNAVYRLKFCLQLTKKAGLFQVQISQFLSSFVTSELSLTKLTSNSSSWNLLSLSIRYEASSCLAFSHTSPPLSCLQPEEQVQWCRAATRTHTHAHINTHDVKMLQSEEVTWNLCFPSSPDRTLSPFPHNKKRFWPRSNFSSEQPLKSLRKISKLISADTIRGYQLF